MDHVKYYGCYDYNKDWYLIEMVLDVPASEIPWNEICVPEPGIKEENWQVPYMEQYLNADGTEKICETYAKPEGSAKPCRVAFFVYKTLADTLSTPYGAFQLCADAKVPERLERLERLVEWE